MLVSFILVYQDINLSLKDTIDSIKAQTDDDYEIVLIADRTIEENANDEKLMDLFWNNSNIKLAVNSQFQGASVSWNTGVDLAEGKYVKFIKQGVVLKPEFIATIKEQIKKHKNQEVDLIEYKVNLIDGDSVQTETHLEEGRLYNLSSEFEPFAYANILLYNKLFRTKILKEFGFRFRRFVRFDLLFVYKVLGQTNTFLFVDSEPLSTINLGPAQHSVFDSVNQWIHILNYYRRIGKFKELKDYLNYSYYKVLIYLWLQEIRKYDNKLLIRKATNFASGKFEDKREDFVKSNVVFKNSKDEKFKSVVNNFHSYIKECLKSAK